MPPDPRDKIATCGKCGTQYPRPPEPSVPCPTCGAPVGTWCLSPKGHAVNIHTLRERAAQKAGFRCGCTTASHPSSSPIKLILGPNTAWIEERVDIKPWDGKPADYTVSK